MPMAEDAEQLEGSLKNKRILIALSGGIACYKTATLISRLVQAGAEVRVIMLSAALAMLVCGCLSVLNERLN